MFWLILGIASLVLLIVGIVLYNVSYRFEEIGISISLIFGICLFICALVIPIGMISSNQSITVFKQHKEYIETHMPSDSVENAALTNKKIELNDWLFSAQYAKKHYGIFVFYPDDILDLEPIE